MQVRMESDKVMCSIEKVKPSSPTPKHLHKYKLSMLDQIAPPMIIPIVLYFVPGNSTSNIADHQTSIITQRLKRSLSKTLTRFYPLAGKITGDGQSVDCNDQGVPFTVAKFTGHKLSDLLENVPDQDLPRQLLPCEITWDAERPIDSCVALIQISHFDCGGFAVGVVLWHKVADAMSIGTFLQSWAATCNLGSCINREPVSPDYTAVSVFPQREELAVSQSGSLAAIMRRGKSVMRRYVFDKTSILSLKAASSSSSPSRSSSPSLLVADAKRRGPSRVEVVSALIWKCFMAASLANNKSVSVMTHAVNIRSRAHTPFPTNCFGNLVTGSVAVSTNHMALTATDLVGKMRDAISKVDGDFVERMMTKEEQCGVEGYRENLRRMWSDVPEGADPLGVSSWCNMGLYDVDFGWGKPTWLNRCDTSICDLDSPFLNCVWLIDTREGDGIEAWVILDEKYMSVFDNVPELRAHAVVDPSPLNNIDPNTHVV